MSFIEHKAYRLKRAGITETTDVFGCLIESGVDQI